MYNNWIEQMEEGNHVRVMMIDQPANFDPLWPSTKTKDDGWWMVDGELSPQKVTEYIGRWSDFNTIAAVAVFSNRIRITLSSVYKWFSWHYQHPQCWLRIKTVFVSDDTTSIPKNIWSDMVQPHLVNTRAAAHRQIRFGNNYRGESELARNSFKYRAQRYYLRINVSATQTFKN